MHGTDGETDKKTDETQQRTLKQTAQGQPTDIWQKCKAIQWRKNSLLQQMLLVGYLQWKEKEKKKERKNKRKRKERNHSS